jgi:phospholipase D1/2
LSPRTDTSTTVKNFDDYDKYLPAKGTKAGHIYDKMTPAVDIKRKLDEIKGHLVWMPMDFLKDAEMAETGMAVNSWTESIYT